MKQSSEEDEKEKGSPGKAKSKLIMGGIGGSQIQYLLQTSIETKSRKKSFGFFHPHNQKSQFRHFPFGKRENSLR